MHEVLHYKHNVLSKREHRRCVPHVFCMRADVVCRFRIVGTLRQPLLYCVAVGRRMVVYAALETASTWHVSCTKHWLHRLNAQMYTTTVLRFQEQVWAADHSPLLDYISATTYLSTYVILNLPSWSTTGC